MKRALKSELKRRSVAGTGKKPRLVMTRCFGIRPKHAVVLASAATLNRGEYLPLADADHSGEAASILLSAAEV